ncbi:MAG: hypothetical protein LCH63_20580 [Candidatus Melainabacteria bacterium]|nr:hypothetical protein [Candidatus Melainabacteria bacterium]OPZ90738.1 MAG: hypothetical protein BWY75_00603 [bacterium ADurb.Bin425]
MKERGVDSDNTTIYRWFQHHAPEMEKRLRWHDRPALFYSTWHIDETYFKVKGAVKVPLSRDHQRRQDN